MERVKMFMFMKGKERKEEDKKMGAAKFFRRLENEQR